MSCHAGVQLGSALADAALAADEKAHSQSMTAAVCLEHGSRGAEVHKHTSIPVNNLLKSESSDPTSTPTEAREDCEAQLNLTNIRCTDAVELACEDNDPHSPARL